MKKFVLSTLLAFGAVTLTFVVRRAMLDMSESNELWNAVTDDVLVESTD